MMAALAGWLCAIGRGAATAAEADAAAFYNPHSVQTIHLEVSSDNLAAMQRALPRRLFVPGAFRWNEHVMEGVGIRYKGDSSSAPNSPHKRSFLIKFPEFKRDQRFLGLRRVALDNGIQFGSLFSERLITDALRSLGVQASRCNYAKVYLNQQYLGVYVNVERVDESFLETHFGGPPGVLFKVDQGGPGADLRYLGDHPAAYQKTFELDTGNPTEAFRQLVGFLRALNAPDLDAAALRRLLDLEALVKTTAVLLFAGAFDQYTGWGPHNYYLYHHPADQRWTYIPWDLDVAFADKAFGRVPVLEGWHAAWPAPVPGRPLMERLVTDTALLEVYRQQASAILEAWFRPEVLIPKLRGLYAQVQAALEEDPYPPRRVTVPSDSGYPGILSSMEEFIRRRYALARAQLDHPGPRPQPKPMGPAPESDGPKPGPPSADAPTDLRAVNLTSALVELHWTDQAQGEVAFVVQRCAGADSNDFTNLIGQPGQDVSSAIDRQVEPGQTYRYRVYAVFPTPQGPRGSGVSNVITVKVPEG
jgi:hypothetical protein